MKLATPPIRFLAMVGALWIGGRIWWLLPDAARQSVVLPSPAAAERPNSLHAPLPSLRSAPVIAIESNKPVPPLLLAHVTNPTTTIHLSTPIPVSTRPTTTASPHPSICPPPSCRHLPRAAHRRLAGPAISISSPGRVARMH